MPLRVTPRHSGRRRGQTLVELALILPIFILFLLGIAEFGSAFADHLALGQASREAVRSASLGSDLCTVLERAENSSLGLANRGTAFDVSISHSVDNGATFTAPTLITEATCGANTVPPGSLVRITIIHNHPMVTGTFFSFLPGVVNGDELPLAQSLVMRRE